MNLGQLTPAGLVGSGFFCLQSNSDTSMQESRQHFRSGHSTKAHENKVAQDASMMVEIGLPWVAFA